MNNVFEAEDKNMQTPRFSPTVVMFIIIGLILFIGLGVYISIKYYQDWKENQMVTVEKVENQFNTTEHTYETYVSYFKSKGIHEPIAEYTFNVYIEGDGREEIDPMYNDPYIGYFENQNIQGALWKAEDGYIHFLYDTDTGEVIAIADWSDDYTLALEINKKSGEKAILTKEAMSETDQNKRNEIIEEIEAINTELLNLYSKVNNNLGHN